MGDKVFRTEAKAEGEGIHLCRSPLPLTLSTLTGQRRGLRKLYPITGIIQRTVLRITQSHICGCLRLFVATPASSEPGKERLKQLGREIRVRGTRNQDTDPFSRPKKEVTHCQTI